MSTQTTFTPPALIPQHLFDSPISDTRTGLCTNWTWKQFFQKLGTPAQIQIFSSGTHAARLNLAPSSLVPGSIFFETDRNLYYVANTVWRYDGGIMAVTQANLPTDLQAEDAGVLAFVTDYAHLLQWTGSGWTWGPGEQGSDMILTFLNGPSPGTGWQACDGSPNVGVLQSDGTLNFVIVPSTPGSWYRQ